MRILSRFVLGFRCLLFVFLTSKSFSQEVKTVVIQDAKFEQLLNEKRKMNASIILGERFKIQIFSGDSETSKTALLDFRKNFKNMDGTIVFQTPIYKVWVGNFKTRIEGEKKLQEFKKKYPNAFLIKPNK